MKSVAASTLIAAVVVTVPLAALWLVEDVRLEAPTRFVEDHHDRNVYYQRGSWLPREQVPYLEVLSEYPELGTWYCAVPFLFLPDAPSERAVYKNNPSMELFERYANLHSLNMAVCLVLLIMVTAMLARELGNDPRRGLFLLLPSSLYFALNRYDVLPALLISLSLLLLIRKRALLAVFVLSLAVLTKWYAIIFLPFYLNYTRFTLNRRILPPLILSAVTAGAVLGTTFITGGLRYLEISKMTVGRAQAMSLIEAEPLPDALKKAVDALPDPVRTFTIGGARSVLTPYIWQGKRKSNPGGLYQQMRIRWFEIEPNSPEERNILRALTLGQFLIFFFGFLVPMRSAGQLIRWMCLGAAFFVLFAKFYSPQWVMWTTALAAPFMRSRILIGLVVFLELLIYAQMGILRGTSLHGTRNPNQTFELTDLWYHIYDVRIAATALFTLLIVGSIIAYRREPKTPPPEALA